ncbi:beta-alanyl-bioamine nonribosomal peptide synthetase ebony-like, partial [Sitodiplosis mosellana]|uniref:beta-alanyl-bioamine nonribosomal peptide synthetase ebony-like n=1 Tax=Sitodiplosis mosellana TaxID=263140 RepID=UPI002444356D
MQQDDFIISYSRNIRRNSIESEFESEVSRFLCEIWNDNSILDEYPHNQKLVVHGMGIKSNPEISIIKGLNRDTHRLHRIFEANLNSLECGNEPAVIFGNCCDEDCQLTYNQLNQTANQLAAVLLNRISTSELEPNSDGDWIIGVCMPPSDELIITLLAILKTGAAYLPIDVKFPRSRIDHILRETEPTLVIYDNDAVGRSLFCNANASSYSFFKGLLMDHEDTNISDARKLQSASGGHLALVLYTSGSTGVPKGVRLSHAALMNRLQWQWETFPYSSTESIGIFKTALTFVDSISEIWGPLLTKRAILVVSKSAT